MSNLIPTKIITDEGIIAIKNGIKPNKSNLVPVERKPSWLRVNLNTSSKFKELKKIVHQKKLNIWDIAAGIILIKEAGGVVSPLDIKMIKNHSIIASSEIIYDDLSNLLTNF